MYKNLLQETAHRAGLKLPVYTTVRSGPGHIPVFTSSVELAGMSFSGEAAKTKKQAEKNAAIAAWSALKRSKKNVFSFCLSFLFLLFHFSHYTSKSEYLCCSAEFGVGAATRRSSRIWCCEMEQ